MAWRFITRLFEAPCECVTFSQAELSAEGAKRGVETPPEVFPPDDLPRSSRPKVGLGLVMMMMMMMPNRSDCRNSIFSKLIFVPCPVGWYLCYRILTFLIFVPQDIDLAGFQTFLDCFLEVSSGNDKIHLKIPHQNHQKACQSSVYWGADPWRSSKSS